eukprot:TRINITY_DN3587_c0_g1_i2.p1 TRINITY_DN3587_c0_g1~~TRINITY_DN3587_c0_g1_i2.p1  ORF type:complete len:158 (+),score=48.03 TRINITY_DN3587_c0_g1_i2:314-787(+)
MQHRIVFEEEKANRAKENEEKYRKQVVDIKALMDKEKNEKEQIIYAMSSQTKRMEDDYLSKINKLEIQVKKEEEELKEKEQALLDLERDTDEELQRKQEEIRLLNNNMEMMSSEFMGMLKGTLDKMKSRIDTAGSADIIKESEAAIVKKLDEFNKKD